MIYFLILVLVVIIGLIIIGFYFYNFSFRRNRKDLLKHELELEELFEHLKECKEWLRAQECEEVKIQSKDQLQLKGILLPSKEKNNRFVILIHGYHSQGKDMAGFARVYHERFHINVLMPDLRGHGRSEGEYIGFGWHDRLDIINWIHYLINRFGKDIEIILHGISMGAATACMVSGEEIPDNVKFIVSDCAYDSIQNILTYQIYRMYKLPPFPIINVTSLICKLRVNYFFKEGNVVNQVKKSKIPMIFIHGDEDTFVPTNMVYNLYDSANTDKELLIINGAKHGDCHTIDMMKYDDLIEKYIQKYL